MLFPAALLKDVIGDDMPKLNANVGAFVEISVADDVPPTLPL